MIWNIGDLSFDASHEFWGEYDNVQNGEAALYTDGRTDLRFEDCPEAFVWSCCEGRGGDVPCVVRRQSATKADWDDHSSAGASDDEHRGE